MKKENDNYIIVHPIFDEPEEKVDVDAAGPMKMTKIVKFSLLTLRTYLIIMMILSLYRILVVSKIIK